MQMIIAPVNAMLLVHGLLLCLFSAAKWLSYAPFKHNLDKVRREREDKGTKSLILEVIWLLVFCFCFFLLKYVHMHNNEPKLYIPSVPSRDTYIGSTPKIAHQPQNEQTSQCIPKNNKYLKKASRLSQKLEFAL